MFWGRNSLKILCLDAFITISESFLSFSVVEQGLKFSVLSKRNSFKIQNLFSSFSELQEKKLQRATVLGRHCSKQYHQFVFEVDAFRSELLA